MARKDVWFIRASIFTAALVLLCLLGLIVFPFLSAVTAAATLALILHPLKQRFSTAFPNSESIICGALTVLIFIALVLPLTAASWTLVREARHALPLVRDWIVAEKPPEPLEPLRGVLQSWGLNPRQLFLDNLDQFGAWSSRFVSSTIRNTLSAATSLIIFGALLFYFLRNGAKLIQRLMRVTPAPESWKVKIVSRVRDVLLAVIRGVFLVALTQGIVAWIGFHFFNVPFPILLASLCMLFSPLPMVGGAIVWVPVVAAYFATAEYSRAILLLLWFGLFYSFIDNLIRPIWIGTQTKISLSLVLLGLLGGLHVFGAAGIFIGPIIIAIAMAAADLLEQPDA